MNALHGDTTPRKIAVVTGSRADYGLLHSVMLAIEAHPDLKLHVIVTGTHLLSRAHTVDEVAADFEIAAQVDMQRDGEGGRLADAVALGRGVSGFANLFMADTPDVVLVLGDRIEALAAASAASVGGIRVGHIHGGDRAAGIADEAIRHAITKLAHLHFAATPASVERILYLGELPLHVHLVGSPAIDDLAAIPDLDDEQYEQFGSPQIVFLLHPTNLPGDGEFANAERLLRLCTRVAPGRVLALHPNNDAGREGIMEAIEMNDKCVSFTHLPREKFVGVCRRAKVIVGNSSAGLIECAALGLPCINVGPRQYGREMPPTVRNIHDWDFGDIDMALERIMSQPRPTHAAHPYGDGTAGIKTARILATFNPAQYPLAKRNTY